jgi:hypothetical protein
VDHQAIAEHEQGHPEKQREDDQKRREACPQRLARPRRFDAFGRLEPERDEKAAEQRTEAERFDGRPWQENGAEDV